MSEGTWPECWRLRWVEPLYKRKLRPDAKNYRGTHLTPQISKVAERVVGKTVLPWLNRNNKFGERQYAYSLGKSHRDPLAANVFSWLLHFEDSRIIALYCSDVSGVFDRVKRECRVQKLVVSSVHPLVIRFRESLLKGRRNLVVVGGAASG